MEKQDFIELHDDAAESYSGWIETFPGDVQVTYERFLALERAFAETILNIVDGVGELGGEG